MSHKHDKGKGSHSVNHQDPVIQSFCHYIDSYNEHDMDQIMGHLDPACVAEVHRSDGTVMTITPSQMRPSYEDDFRKNQTVVVESVKRVTDDGSVPAGQVAVRTMIHTSKGKYLDVTYYMRENDLIMVKHVIHKHGDL
jgi:hypothetical protein